MHIEPAQYDAQLAQKVTYIESQFSHLTMPNIVVYESPRQHYRMRAEFRVWHDGDDLYHIMFDPDTKQKIRVDQFLPACEIINKAMLRLMEHLRGNAVLRKKLFQIDYLASLSGQLVVSFLYHRQLDDEWQEQVSVLRAKLSNEFDVHFIGRARKQKLLVEQDFVIETLPINGRNYHFKHIENSFTQPNAMVNCAMIEWAIAQSESQTGDLVEFYCGAGNFSLPLAQQFDRVIGTEIAKPSVEAAQFNIRKNDLNNVEIVRLSAEEFTSAMRKERKFQRLGDIDLDTYSLKTVLVDPPRSGLDDKTLKLVQEFECILYISCNPDTLLDNLCSLSDTHTIESFAVFDQFPYTHHIECGVKLIRKS